MSGAGAEYMVRAALIRAGLEPTQKERREAMQGRDIPTAEYDEAARQKEPLPEDNWRHRGVKMRCSSCMWFVPKFNTANLAAVGRCRRHAPTLGGWPVTYGTDWCGDHKLDEEKV